MKPEDRQAWIEAKASYRRFMATPAPLWVKVPIAAAIPVVSIGIALGFDIYRGYRRMRQVIRHLA